MVQAAPDGSTVLLSLVQQMEPGCCMLQDSVARDTAVGWWYTGATPRPAMGTPGAPLGP